MAFYWVAKARGPAQGLPPDVDSFSESTPSADERSSFDLAMEAFQRGDHARAAELFDAFSQEFSLSALNVDAHYFPGRVADGPLGSHQCRQSLPRELPAGRNRRDRTSGARRPGLVLYRPEPYGRGLPTLSGDTGRISAVAGIDRRFIRDRTAGMQLTADIADRLSNSLKHVAGLEGSGKLAVAVSGGGDSTALMTMLKPWCSERGLELRAVSVNHGLRKESGTECEFVALLASRLGIQHDVFVV